MKFEFNEGAINKLVQDVTRGAASELERDLNRFSAQLKGRPIEEIKVTLQRHFQGKGGKLTEPDLSRWAKDIQDGKRVVVNVK